MSFGDGAQATAAKKGESIVPFDVRPALFAFYVFPDAVEYPQQPFRGAWGESRGADWDRGSLPPSSSMCSLGTDLSQCHLSRYENVILATELDFGHESTNSGFLRTRNSSMVELTQHRSCSEKGLARTLSVGGNSDGEEVAAPTISLRLDSKPSLGPTGCASLPLRKK